MNMNATCPKCGTSVSMVLQDTKNVQSYALCPKCGIVFKVS